MNHFVVFWIVLALALLVAVIEQTDVPAEIARRIVRWSAYRRYSDPSRAQTRAEELEALINDRPWNVLRLGTAFTYAVAAARSAPYAVRTREAPKVSAAPLAPVVAAPPAAETMESQAAGTTVRRIMLGAQLRRLREAKGVTRQDAGYAIRASESKISLLELGRVSFKERDVSDLLTLYGVTDEAERESLLRLARNANTSDWWHRYNDVLPGWFQTYVGLEEQAALVRIYESRFVPELLQTEQYARATFPQCHSQAVEREIDLRVELRMQRQQRLTTPDAPKLWVVLDEAALNRFPGGPEVMRGQFEHLIEMSRLPNVAIQIMPFWFGRHVPVNGTFTMLRFPEQDVPEMVYIETLAGAMYLDKRDEVNAYQMAMERLCTESEPQDRTIEILYDLVRRSA
ncbi:hypothetical protein amrb99_59270 [Actinomadura sp. RB99]|uniref:helix-turn-helix domain-containing protein n=1 Tax=Actinomadura sp. RB99 TaxID=2691577 RepID=UPI0019A28B1F|nr:hypothetical protein [Actinomadura sp. RB99]